MVEPTEQQPSPTLLAAARQGDPAAWQRLVELYTATLLFWVRRMGVADADADDIAQEAWLSVNANLAKIHCDRPSDTFRGWLWVLVRNKVHDFRRRQGAVASGGTDANIHLQNWPESEPLELSTADAPSLLQRAVELIRPQFEPHTWQAFWRTTVLDQPARQVAADLGIAPNAVHQAKFRVLKKLRQELADLGIADDPALVKLLGRA
jgi:RNA polymerase sigma-70 factor, ECF subfamily